MIANRGGQLLRGDDSGALKQAVLDLAQTAGAQSNEVRDWLRHSEIVKADKDGDFHSEFANNLQLQSDAPLEFSTKFKVGDDYGSGGVDQDPWLAPSAAQGDGDLNLAEMES
jgi:hypothetical protein